MSKFDMFNENAIDAQCLTIVNIPLNYLSSGYEHHIVSIEFNGTKSKWDSEKIIIENVSATAEIRYREYTFNCDLKLTHSSEIVVNEESLDGCTGSSLNFSVETILKSLKDPFNIIVQLIPQPRAHNAQ